MGVVLATAGRSLRSQLRYANSLGAPYVPRGGEAMAKGEQRPVSTGGR